MRILALLLPALAATPSPAQWIYAGDTTATWEQAISRYEELDRRHEGAKLFTIGNDDDGSPIHLFVIADGSPVDPADIRAQGKNILWITNAIHPGEPDGVDASLMLAQALLESDQLMGLVVHTAVCIVPMYNVSGARQRRSPSRPDQDGPVEHGIRANAKNLDLNRDFVKMEALNTGAMITALQQWDPDVYFETHVSDGADHQYVMELVMTQKDRLDPTLAAFMTGTIEPALYDWMDRKNVHMCPYYEPLKEIAEEGIVAFYDAPRYSTGLNALFDRIGILSESHMLKPYADRVNATFQLMLATLAVMNEHPQELHEARARARKATASATSFSFNWTRDTTQVSQLPFKGYTAVHEPSPVSGLQRLRYDRARPTTVQVPFYDRYVSSRTIRKPSAYLVPQAWKEVTERLLHYGTPVIILERDSTFDAEVYRLDSFHTGDAPFEGHYRHSDTHCSVSQEQVTGHKGDLLVLMGSPSDRFVMNVLEPEAEDSYFSWGFFDAVLQQKEWFNDYVFEEIAADLLTKDEALRTLFQEKRASDPAFAADGWEQLRFIFERSPWFEKAYLRYPVFRVGTYAP